MQGKLISTKITLHTNKIQVRLRISYLIYLLGQAIYGVLYVAYNFCRIVCIVKGLNEIL